MEKRIVNGKGGLWEIVQTNPDKQWDWFALSLNESNYNNRVFKNKYQGADMDMDEILLF